MDTIMVILGFLLQTTAGEGGTGILGVEQILDLLKVLIMVIIPDVDLVIKFVFMK
jgi:hypothetical protein